MVYHTQKNWKGQFRTSTEMSSILGSILLRHGSMGKKMFSPTMIRPFTSTAVLQCRDSPNDSGNVVPNSEISTPKYTVAKHPFSLTGAPLRESVNADIFAVFEFSGTQYKATVVHFESNAFFFCVFFPYIFAMHSCPATCSCYPYLITIFSK